MYFVITKSSPFMVVVAVIPAGPVPVGEISANFKQLAETLPVVIAV